MSEDTEHSEHSDPPAPETEIADGEALTLPDEDTEAGPKKPGLKVGDLPREIPVRLGRYIIDGELGRGAMGVVYRARQEGLDRPVALKILLRGALASEKMKTRFRREAKSIARLRHPNIVTVYEIGEFEDQPFFTMELIDGLRLDLFNQRVNMSPGILADMCRRIAEAVHEAHRYGIIHRDLKPSNILVNAAHEPVITDFGLAKDMDSFTMLSMTGDIMGTPAYMAPEQADGRVSEVGVRSDIYALGSILYALLLKRDPFQGRTMVETLNRVIHEEPPPVHQVDPSLDPELAAICSKAMEKQPQLRYNTAQEMAEDLARFIDGRPVLARRWSWRRGVRKWARRNRDPLVISTAAAVAMVLASVFALQILSRDYLDHTQQQLKADDPAMRTAAVASLGRELSGPEALKEEDRKEATALFLSAFQDSDQEVRSGFLAALADTPEVFSGNDPLPDGLVPWLKAVSEIAEQPEQANLALEALGAIRRPDIAEYLISRLREPNPAVRLRIIRSLGRQRSRQSIGPLMNVIITDPVGRAEAEAALDRFYEEGRLTLSSRQDRAARQALSQLQSAISQYQEQFEALESGGAGRTADDPWQPYRRAVQSGTPEEQLAALQELGRAEAPSASAVLLEVLRAGEPVVADAAAVILGRQGHEQLLGKLHDVLKDSAPETRRRAAVAMGFAGRSVDADHLLSAIPLESDPSVQQAMVRALGEIGDPDSAPALRALQREFPSLGTTIDQALQRLERPEDSV